MTKKIIVASSFEIVVGSSSLKMDKSGFKDARRAMEDGDDFFNKSLFIQRSKAFNAHALTFEKLD